MSVFVVGMSHKTAPIELREKLAISSEKIEEAFSILKERALVEESVILSTCNRTEVYARIKNDPSSAVRGVHSFFQSLYDHPQLSSVLYEHHSQKAVEHLFRVTSGLDSMMVGETEILGQVKNAYQRAKEKQATGKITNVWFQRALFVGKQVRTQTELSEGAVSVGNFAVRLAQKIFGNLQDRKTLILGAGEMAEVIARHLASQKAGPICVLNRTESQAEKLAGLFSGEFGSLEKIEEKLSEAQIVIGSAASPKTLISKEMIQRIMKNRNNQSLYLIDVSVPRLIDPEVHQVDNVYLYNVDDLKKLVDEQVERRKEEISKAEKMVMKMTNEFVGWVTASLNGQKAALKHNNEK